MTRLTLLFVVAMGCAAVAAPASAQDSRLPPEINSLVQLINAHDVDGLLARVRYVPQPCVAEPQGIDQPRPQCPMGIAPGTLVDTFHHANCEGGFVVGPAPARAEIESRFRQFPESYVLEVLSGEDYRQGRPQVQYLVVTTQEGAHQGLLWYVTIDGMLDSVVSTCSSVAEDAVAGYIRFGLIPRLGTFLPVTGYGSDSLVAPGMRPALAVSVLLILGSMSIGLASHRRW